MKQLFLTPIFILLSFFSISVSHAMTADVPTSSAQVTDERTLRGDLKVRKQDGTLETTVGQYKLSAGVEVIDHRKIDDWYKQPADAQISLYFKNDRLIRVVIY